MQAVVRGRREVKAARERGGFFVSPSARASLRTAPRARARVQTSSPRERPRLVRSFEPFSRSTARARRPHAARSSRSRARREAPSFSFASTERDAREAMVDDASRARESFRSCARLHSPTRSTTHLDAFATTCADARARIGWTDKITNHRRGWVVILSEMSECTYITTFTSMYVYL
jgi:hypothetical protein